MPPRKSSQSDRNAARKSKSSVVDEPEPVPLAGGLAGLALSLVKGSVLFQVGPKLPAVMKQLPEVVKQLKSGTYQPKAENKQEPAEVSASDGDAAQEEPEVDVDTSKEPSVPVPPIDEGKGDAASLFSGMAARLSLTNPLGLFPTGEDGVKAFKAMKSLEFDGGPKAKKKGTPVMDRLQLNVQNHLTAYIHVVWALMMLRSFLFRSFFACLPWLFLYQVLSVTLPLQKTDKVPLPLEKAPVELRLLGTVSLHSLVWIFFIYEFVFRVWWLEWFFAVAVIGAHAYLFRHEA